MKGKLFNLFLLITQLIFCQDKFLYNYFVSRGDSFLDNKKYFEAAISYQKAFNSFGGKSHLDDRYNAAIAWTYAGFNDSALHNLGLLTSKACYLRSKSFELNPNFSPLHSEKRWILIKEKVEEEDKNKNCHLAKLIDSLSNSEAIIRNDYGYYPILRGIVLKYGFPGFELVGEVASRNFGLLVQHQDSYPEFQDTVLKLVEKAYLIGDASGATLAYLTDRVRCNKGKLQIYGTQVNWINKKCYPKPVLDSINLNFRRNKVGLTSEEDYLILMEKRYIKKK
ncbi:MAG: DUF6624 domain-containing protein [Bacteroidia bacterium]